MWGPEDSIPVGYTNSSSGHQMDEIDRSIYGAEYQKQNPLVSYCCIESSQRRKLTYLLHTDTAVSLEVGQRGNQH